MTKKKECCYFKDSNELEWGSNKSSSDYDLAKIFGEPSEPTQEERFTELFKVGQATSNVKRLFPVMV